MYVVKRDGCRQILVVDKIQKRISHVWKGLNHEFIDVAALTVKVSKGLYAGVTTAEVDTLIAETAAAMTTRHPDYAQLASRITTSHLHKETKECFSDVMDDLYSCLDHKTGQRSPVISSDVHTIVMNNRDKLNAAIMHENDFTYSYFGYKTMEKSYLFRIGGKVVERPQHMLMRVAVSIHRNDVYAAIETYRCLSEKFFVFSSPTLFNAGTNRPQLASCYLVSMESDSMESVYNTLKKCALISRHAGGIGLNVHCVRAAGSTICGTNGTATGLTPMLRVYNNASRHADQGGCKRPGAFAIYLEPWHADIFDFLDLKKNTGKEEQRARDLFYALWIPDLFMKRVESNADWTLMCPHECPGLGDVWGEEFDKLYTKHEADGKGRKTIKARDVWYAITEAQTETGTPYMLYKDSCNRKSNHQHLGTIKGGNLCSEIIQFTSSEEVSVCNVASVALNMFVKPDRTYDFEKLREVTKLVVQNLNKAIDVNFYPLQEARASHRRHRSVAVGVQGLADAFILMRLPFDNEAAQKLNREIFEHMYYACLDASSEIAEKEGPYESYHGSPFSKGILQFDMWGVVPVTDLDWTSLRMRISKHGTRNSLLMAPMPTASTAQILGNNESIEAYTSNIYTRRVLSGEFQVVNQHLVRDLVALHLWNDLMKQRIISQAGSVQGIEEIPQDIKALYKTVWEISQKTVIKMAADRGAYIDQSQSLNIHIAEPNYGKLTSMHFYAWKMGLKTGMYYLRTKPAANAIQFTIDKSRLTIKLSAADQLLEEVRPLVGCCSPNEDWRSCNGRRKLCFRPGASE